jgi:hypothetical protein
MTTGLSSSSAVTFEDQKMMRHFHIHAKYQISRHSNLVENTACTFTIHDSTIEIQFRQPAHRPKNSVTKTQKFSKPSLNLEN